MSEEKKDQKMDLTRVISTAIQLPGVKVSRNDFLQEQFKDSSPEELSRILKDGPIMAGCSRDLLMRKANKIVTERTLFSTGASFLAGLPGGIAMAATIPADILQFYGVALRMAQELVYLYGEQDMWCDGAIDPEKVTNQLILYCGVMLGVVGAAQTVRLMSSALAKQALKKLPRLALTKTFYYPIIKSIVKFFGGSLTKNTFAKGVSKVVPVIGGVVSGGITWVSMRPMGKRLATTLDKAHFDYSMHDIESDFHDISKFANEEGSSITVDVPKLEGSVGTSASTESPYDKLRKLKALYDDGIITSEEYADMKNRIFSQI